jgi:hypothetical protein
VLDAFAYSDAAKLVLDGNAVSSWTFTRRGYAPDGYRSMREVHNVVAKMAATMPDAPIYVTSFTSDDEHVLVLNTGVAAAAALDAHADVMARRVKALKRANDARKALAPNASPSRKRATLDRVNRAEAKVKIAKADAKRLLQATLDAKSNADAK